MHLLEHVIFAPMSILNVYSALQQQLVHYAIQDIKGQHAKLAALDFIWLITPPHALPVVLL